MSIALLATDTTVICRVIKALYDAAPGYTYLQNFLSYKSTNGLGATVNELTNSFSSSSNAELAALVSSNIGLTGSAYTAGVDYLTAQFNAVASTARGQVIANAMQALSNLSGDATFGSYADAFNSSVSTSEAYSTNSSNTTTNLATLQAADEVSSTLSLTTASDTLSGTTGADLFLAVAGTLAGDDNIAGGAGSDVATFAVQSAIGAFTMTDVETLNVKTTGTALALDLANVTGLNTLTLYGNASSVAVTNIESGAFTLSFGTGYHATGTTFAFADETTAEAITLTIDGASAFEIREAAGSIETVTIGAIQNYTNVTAGAIAFGSAVSSIALNGASLGIGLRVESANSAFSLTSTNTASVNLRLDLLTGASTSALASVTLGSANDTLTIGTAMDAATFGGNRSALALNGGNGTDTLAVAELTGALTVWSAVTNFEVLQLNIVSAAVTVGTAFNAGSVKIGSTALASAVVTLGSQNSVTLNNAASGAVSIVLGTTATTADSLTVYLDNVSAVNLNQSGQGIENITINWLGQTTAIGSATNAFTAGSASNFSVGSAAVTLVSSTGGMALQLTMSGAAATGVSTVNAASVIGDASIDIVNQDSEEIRVTMGTGNDRIDFGGMNSAGNGVTAIVNGGAGTDTLAFLVNTSNIYLANWAATSVETLELSLQISGMNTGLINLGSRDEITTLNLIKDGITGMTAAYSVRGLGSVEAVNYDYYTAATAAAGSITLNYEGDAAAVTLRTRNSAGIDVVDAGTLSVASASTITLTVTDSGATAGGSLSIATVDLNDATTDTINVNFDFLIATELNVDTADTVTLNVSSGANLTVASATMTAAGTFTLNSVGSGSVSLAQVLVGSGTTGGNLVVSLSGSGASATVGSAIVGGNLTLSTNGGTAGNTIVMGLVTVAAGVSSGSTAVAPVITIDANGSADSIAFSALALSTMSADSIIMNINANGGAGDVSISALTVGTAWAATSLDVNASAMVGTLRLQASGFDGNLVIDLGTDVASSNNVRGGLTADKIYGGGNGDNIHGGAGNDTIYGYGGADTLDGGKGSDSLYGGDGSDIFVFEGASAGNVQGVGGSFADTVMDWGSGDKFYFSGVTAIASSWSTVTAYNSITFATSTLIGANTAMTGGSAHFLAIYQNGGDTYIELALDMAVGTAELGSAVNRIVLNGLSGWTAVSGQFSFTLTASGLVIQSV